MALRTLLTALLSLLLTSLLYVVGELLLSGTAQRLAFYAIPFVWIPPFVWLFIVGRRLSLADRARRESVRLRVLVLFVLGLVTVGSATILVMLSSEIYLKVIWAIIAANGIAVTLSRAIRIVHTNR